MWPSWLLIRIGVFLAVFFTAVFIGCRRADSDSVAPTVAKPAATLPDQQLKPQLIGETAKRPPWIAHVAAVDLDRDGLLDVLACEAQENQILWLRQTSRGVFAESVIGSGLKAPVHVEAG